MREYQKRNQNIEILKGKDCYLTADYDSLTGAFNFMSFRENLEYILRNGTEEDRMACILYLDIANFHNYNQQNGYERGDQMLICLADIIEEVLPDRLMGRLDNDHFVIYCFEDETIAAIEKINELFYQVSMDISMSIRAGIYRIIDNMVDVSFAIDSAHLAADSTRGHVGVLSATYDESMTEILQLEKYVVENIDKALAEGYISVFYQPVIRTLGREVCGMEALSRWNDPVHGLISPAIFIEALEKAHLIYKLDCHVVQQVCQDLFAAREMGDPLVPVSINVSRLDMELCDIVSIVQEAAKMYIIPPRLLCIEITESVFSNDTGFMKSQVDKLHAAGFEVWMDDFGSGYSSLNILKNFRFDVLKIDMLFLKDESARARQIMSSIVDMAKKIGIRTLAEGVETQEQLEFLRDIGCEKAQGYLIDKPEPYREMCRTLDDLGYIFEKKEMRSYLDALGEVNFLGIDPIISYTHLGDTGEVEHQKSVPLAIVEFDDDRVQFLFANDEYIKCLQVIGLNSIEEAQRNINNVNDPLSHHLRRAAEQIRGTNKDGYFDVQRRGAFFTVRAKWMSSYKDYHAYLTTIEPLSEELFMAHKMQACGQIERFYDAVGRSLNEQEYIIPPVKDNTINGRSIDFSRG